MQNTLQELNSLRPKQDGRHFTDDIFKSISLLYLDLISHPFRHTFDYGVCKCGHKTISNTFIRFYNESVNYIGSYDVAFDIKYRSTLP